uniref:mammalian ependymin-related protein 1-like isoform X2 n=1 Tax=Myxine glutinosa TaxID=7769 RepID=UPI00358F2A68
MASVLLCLHLLGALLASGHGLTNEPRKVPCVAPTRWEGRIVRFEQNSAWNTRSVVSYDAVKMRVRFLEEKKSIIPCKRFYEYIKLYADGVQYKIEQVTKACKKSPLHETFDPFDIPANSTFEDDYRIGGPGDQLLAQEWSDRKPSRMRGLQSRWRNISKMIERNGRHLS